MGKLSAAGQATLGNRPTFNFTITGGGKTVSDFGTGSVTITIPYTLQAGEGLICNNVLHNRTQFTDSDDPALKRLLYRGRYYQRVAEPTTGAG